MVKKFTLLFSIITLLIVGVSFGQISITSTGTPFSENFNTLAATGTSGTLPSGWAFLETGTNANTTYAASTGSDAGGNTYSYGATANAERALGTLLSGSLTPIIGASFTNNSGANITSLTIVYTGEQWRLGTLSRIDKLDFQYSLDATSLNTGTFTDVDNLDFIAPVTTGTIGALNGNAAPNQTLISFEITGLNIAVGSSFWIRWTDPNASSADDGLAIDDFSITANGTPLSPCLAPTAQPTALILTPAINSISGSFTAASPVADNYLVVRSTSNSLGATPANATNYSIGDAIGNGFVISKDGNSSFTDANLTASTTYYYFIFSFNNINCSGGPLYLATTELNGNTTTLAVPNCVTPTIPTNLSFSSSSTTVTGSFTGSGASKYLVIQTTSTPFTGSVANGTSYNVGSTLGNGTVISYGINSNFTASGLTPLTTYYYFVFAANDACVGEPFYSATSLDGTTATTDNNIPAGYYNAAAGLTCAPLKTALNSIITNGHTQNSYGGLDDIEMPVTDNRLNDAGTQTIVYDMYSDNPTGPEPYTFTFAQFNIGSGTDGEGNGWNKEHSFPNSWFSATSSTGNFPGADLFHLYPTDMDVNSLRGNYPYGKVATASTTTANGSKLGTSSISFPGYSGPVFEPIDAFKGDLARSTLYMVTRYQSEQPSWENLQSTGDVVMDGTTWPSIEPSYLQMLLNWHNADPVSAKELKRNNDVFGFQHNRNPFIDHPEYVNLIWGGACFAVPVNLTEFNVKLVNNTAQLNWKAENPQNFSHFEIERSSDGIYFSKIGIAATSNSNQYNFIDNNLPQTNMVFYRLKMVDIDGHFEFSKIVSLGLSLTATKALVYPNPVRNILKLKLYEPLFTNSSMTITDATGRTLISSTLSAGKTEVETKVNNLAAGRYFILIKNNKQNIRESFIILN